MAARLNVETLDFWNTLDHPDMFRDQNLSLWMKGLVIQRDFFTFFRQRRRRPLKKCTAPQAPSWKTVWITGKYFTCWQSVWDTRRIALFVADKMRLGTLQRGGACEGRIIPQSTGECKPEAGGLARVSNAAARGIFASPALHEIPDSTAER